ncbi:DUF2147 domain-containing protein [Devosia sp.]|uniref:DUF2147 domain-containing protein n=1 Tax=Devosia sp. TaxID=1871048 RepID=UPI0032646AF9
MALIMLLEGPALAQEPIEGVWVTRQQSEITVRACGAGYCGVLSKVVVPDEVRQSAAEESATVGLDFRNKEPKLRDRPLLGQTILQLKASSKPGIYDGEIYNPEDGNTYSGYLEVLGPDSVRLKGCVLFNIICRGEDWVRVGQ